MKTSTEKIRFSYSERFYVWDFQFNDYCYWTNDKLMADQVIALAEHNLGRAWARARKICFLRAKQENSV